MRDEYKKGDIVILDGSVFVLLEDEKPDGITKSQSIFGKMSICMDHVTLLNRDQIDFIIDMATK